MVLVPVFSSGNQLTILFDTVDYSIITSACDIDTDLKVIDIDRAGGASTARIPGIKKHGYKWKMAFDPTVYAALVAIRAESPQTPRVLVVSADGGVSTETSSVLVSKISRKGSPDKQNELEVELLVDGDVT
jgi:hypothetical protein